MMKRIRIRATGQVDEFIPDVAEAMLRSGIAEAVPESVSRQREPENAMAAPVGERAVTRGAAAARSRGRR